MKKNWALIIRDIVIAVFLLFYDYYDYFDTYQYKLVPVCTNYHDDYDFYNCKKIPLYYDYRKPPVYCDYEFFIKKREFPPESYNFYDSGYIDYYDSRYIDYFKELEYLVEVNKMYYHPIWKVHYRLATIEMDTMHFKDCTLESEWLLNTSHYIFELVMETGVGINM